MKRLRFIGRRLLNGVLTSLTVLVLLVTAVFVIAVFSGAVRVLDALFDGIVYLWLLSYSIVSSGLDRLGVPVFWTDAVMVALALMIATFVIGCLAPDDSEVKVRGVEPGVQKEGDEYEEALRVNSARGGDG